ncbi:MAG: Outer membrane protein assembly factor BamB [Verrucomicrobia subdivision 3 bacterium]|nr:Outer membrane protein assembly factor BamB [Limisphaerales bacterium]MCS1416060.1 Outer membrane protein assembly factor BamB [Limisphaerales bacterium]
MRTILPAIAALILATSSPADDWPQWLGPNQDSVWRETGIVDKFPDGGLPIKWRMPVGLGYGGPAVANGKVYVMDYDRTYGKVENSPAGRKLLDGSERVLCFDARTGKPLWKHEFDRPYNLSYPGGPRCTPTVADGKVYALGAEGNFWCLDANNGKVLWKKDYRKDYNLDTPIWGYSSHPVVDGDTLYCIVGGNGTTAIAYNKDTGAEKWRALSSPEPGYGTPALIEHGGQKQLIVWHAQSINSLNPKTGAVNWSIPLKPAYNMAIMTPRKLGSYLFASAIGNVSALIRLDDQKPSASIAWRGNTRNAVYCVNSTPFLQDGTLYGCNVETSELMAVKLDNAERLWATLKPTIGEGNRGRHGTAFIVKHKDRFFLFSETGDLILAKLSPEGYEEISRFHVLEPTNEVFGRPCVWSHPAFAEKSCFARNDKELVRVDLAKR